MDPRDFAQRVFSKNGGRFSAKMNNTTGVPYWTITDCEFPDEPYEHDGHLGFWQWAGIKWRWLHPHGLRYLFDDVMDLIADVEVAAYAAKRDGG